MAVVTHRLPRLYVERELEGNSVALDEREAHYLGHVLRLERGDQLVVFNGRGAERQASVEAVQRRGVDCSRSQRRMNRCPSRRSTSRCVQALPKSDAMDLIVQKATELGVRALVPVYTEFSVVKLDAERSERRLEHWRKIAQSACEQCGRHQPPAHRAAGTARGCARGAAGSRRPLRARPVGRAGTGRADPARDASSSSPSVPRAGSARRIGGGSMPRSSRASRLGPRILRAETAALAVCAIAQSRWGDL